MQNAWRLRCVHSGSLGSGGPGRRIVRCYRGLPQVPGGPASILMDADAWSDSNPPPVLDVQRVAEQFGGIRMIRRFISAALLVSVALPISAQERVPSGERVDLPEARIEIFNAVGTVTLHGTSGRAVTITPTAKGSDAGQLVFEADHDGSRGRFRVVFPDVDRIGTTAELGRYESGDLDLRADGTFGDNDR